MLSLVDRVTVTSFTSIASRGLVESVAKIRSIPSASLTLSIVGIDTIAPVNKQ